MCLALSVSGRFDLNGYMTDIELRCDSSLVARRTFVKRGAITKDRVGAHRIQS